MRTLNSVSEFQTEAANAVFTKQQAISATLQLLTKEWNDPGNTPEEKSVLENAIQRAEFRYIDATKSETDRMLDAIGVARFTTQDIVNAIQAIVFDAVVGESAGHVFAEHGVGEEAAGHDDEWPARGLSLIHI